MRSWNSLFVGMVLTTLSATASAQFAKAEDAIKYRKSALFVMTQHYARVGAMVNGKAPFDPALAQQNIEIARYLSTLPWRAFGPGTEQGDTKAKPEIWMEQEKFKQLSDKMQAEMNKLHEATKTGRLDAIKTAFKATSASCKACHDDYRSK